MEHGSSASQDTELLLHRLCIMSHRPAYPLHTLSSAQSNASGYPPIYILQRAHSSGGLHRASVALTLGHAVPGAFPVTNASSTQTISFAVGRASGAPARQVSKRLETWAGHSKGTLQHQDWHTSCIAGAGTALTGDTPMRIC